MKKVKWIVIVIFIILTTTFALVRMNIKTINKAYMADAQILTTNIAVELHLTIDEQFMLMDSVESFLRINVENPNLGDRFNKFVKLLYEKNEDVKNISIAPEGVQAFVYPIKGNEMVIGHDLLNDERENVRKDVWRTIENRMPAVSGPYELRQGGIGLITRKAVYIEDAFWGLIAMVSDFEKTLSHSGITTKETKFGIRVLNNNGEIVWQNKDTIETVLISESIELPEGKLYIQVLETMASRNQLVYDRGQWYSFGVIVALILLALLNQERRHLRGLEIAVEKRTTALRKATSQLEEMNTQLEEEISEKEAYEIELISAREQAEVSSAAKSVFLSNMSHEIRSPLQGMIGAIELLKIEVMRRESREYLELLSDAAMGLLVILNQILDYSKIAAHSTEIANQPFDLRNTIESVVSLHKLSTIEDHVEFSYNIDGSITGNYFGDSLKVKQILSNIIGNSVKFTECGFIRINVNQVINETQAYINFEIKDSGCGISKNNLNNIFERFEQADNNQNFHKGTGLGLAITKELVSLMNGSIDVESEVGKGTVFTVRLPIEKMQYLEEKLSSPDSSKIEITAKKILLIEDDHISLNILSQMLNTLGQSVTECLDGQCALDKIEEDSFDIVICDYSLPDIQGSELVNALKKDNMTDISYIGLTGHIMQAKDIRKWGVDEYLLKPVGLHDLRKILSATHTNEGFRNTTTSDSSKPVNTTLERFKSDTGFEDAFVREVLTDYLRDARKCTKMIERFVSNEEYEALKSVIHKLKGSALSARDEITYEITHSMELEIKSESINTDLLLRQRKSILNTLNNIEHELNNN